MDEILYGYRFSYVHLRVTALFFSLSQFGLCGGCTFYVKTVGDGVVDGLPFSLLLRSLVTGPCLTLRHMTFLCTVVSNCTCGIIVHENILCLKVG